VKNRKILSTTCHKYINKGEVLFHVIATVGIADIFHLVLATLTMDDGIYTILSTLCKYKNVRVASGILSGHLFSNLVSWPTYTNSQSLFLTLVSINVTSFVTMLSVSTLRVSFISNWRIYIPYKIDTGSSYIS
jgi:hypothetical protein